MESRINDLKLAEKGARVSIIAYILLSCVKLGVGYWAGSKALFADGLNNTTDILASVAVLIGLKIARKPADTEHAYGHLRAETIASLIASMIMIAVGLDVLFKAVDSTIHYKEQAPDLISAFTALFCAFSIYMVSRYNLRLAKQINSSGLMAAAKDNLSDAWVSIGAAVGIFASQFGMPWIDPIAAIIVGVLIIKTGWDIFIEAAHTLTDGYDNSELNKIANQVSAIDGVREIQTIKARIHGNMTFMDLILFVNPNISVVEGHNIAENVEKFLHKEHGITEVIIHIEPDMRQ